MYKYTPEQLRKFRLQQKINLIVNEIINNITLDNLYVIFEIPLIEENEEI